MANYALTVNPKFTPFTYDELIKPIEAYQNVYDTYDATYEKALEDVSKFSSLNAETDNEAYQKYQNYLQNIQNQKEALYKSGLSSSTRRGFQDLRNTYATEIKPMEIAYDKKIEDINNYDKLMMTNPQMRAVRNPHETTLSEYMNNPDLDNRYVDLNAVSKVASDAFSKARQTYLNKSNLDSYTYQIITRYGETPAAIMKGLQEATQDGDPKTRSQAAQIITSIRDSVRNQFGYDDINNDNVRQDIDNTIYNSAWSLQGQEDIKYTENYGARQNAQNAEYDRRLKNQREYEEGKARALAEAERKKKEAESVIKPTSYEYKTNYKRPVVEKFQVDNKGNLTSEKLNKLNKTLDDYINSNRGKKNLPINYSTVVSNYTNQIEKEERRLHMSVRDAYLNLDDKYGLYGDNIEDLSNQQIAERVNLMNELENTHNTKTYRAYEFDAGTNSAGQLYQSLTSAASLSKNIIKTKNAGGDTWKIRNDANKTPLPASSDITSLVIVPEEGLIATDIKGNQYNLSQIDENISAKIQKIATVQNMLNDFATPYAEGENYKEYYTPSANSLNAVLSDYNNGKIPNSSIQTDNKNGLVKIYYNIKTGDNAFPNDLGIVILDKNRKQPNGTYPIYTNRFTDVDNVRADESLKKLTNYTFKDILVENTKGN